MSFNPPQKTEVDIASPKASPAEASGEAKRLIESVQESAVDLSLTIEAGISESQQRKARDAYHRSSSELEAYIAKLELASRRYAFVCSGKKGPVPK